MAAGHTEDVFHHVRDSQTFEVPQFLGGEIHLPEVFGFQITKFMVLEVVAGLVVLVVFRGLARQIGSGRPANGVWWNFWEMLALFIRDQVVRPVIGTGEHGHAHSGSHGGEHGKSHASADAAHPADKYLPYIWTCFFFILICNLLGLIPWLGSPTGHIWMTGALALTTFGVVLRSGMSAMGAVGFWKALVPQMDLPGPMALVLVPMIWAIELFGLLIKHFVLAVRLFANMMGGHTVVFVLMLFIADAGGMFSLLGAVVTPASVLGQVGVNLLELLVAFIQAYVFAFLSTIFISMAIHPH